MKYINFSKKYILLFCSAFRLMLHLSPFYKPCIHAMLDGRMRVSDIKPVNAKILIAHNRTMFALESKSAIPVPIDGEIGPKIILPALTGCLNVDYNSNQQQSLIIWRPYDWAYSSFNLLLDDSQASSDFLSKIENYIISKKYLYSSQQTQAFGLLLQYENQGKKESCTVNIDKIAYEIHAYTPLKWHESFLGTKSNAMYFIPRDLQNTFFSNNNTQPLPIVLHLISSNTYGCTVLMNKLEQCNLYLTESQMKILKKIDLDTLQGILVIINNNNTYQIRYILDDSEKGLLLSNQPQKHGCELSDLENNGIYIYKSPKNINEENLHKPDIKERAKGDQKNFKREKLSPKKESQKNSNFIYLKLTGLTFLALICGLCYYYYK